MWMIGNDTQFLEHQKGSFHTFIVPQFVEEFAWPKASKGTTSRELALGLAASVARCWGAGWRGVVRA